MAGEYRELIAFQKRLQNIEKEKRQFIEKTQKELAARLLRKAIKRTPVGKKPEFSGKKTVKVKVRGAKGTRTRSYLTAKGADYEKYWSGYGGGNLRRGWTGGKSQSPDAHLSSKKIIQVGDKYYLHIFNTVRYASYVEYGHRQKPGRYVPALGKRLKKAWVPGKFMLKSSEAEMKRVAPALVQKRLNEFMKEMMEND